MVMRLAEYLELPLRERNALLLAAGYAPAYAQTSLSAESMRDVRASLQSLVDAHQPCPALAADHAWNLVLANDAALSFAEGASDELMTDPINIIRLVLHPDGLRYVSSWVDEPTMSRCFQLMEADDLSLLQDWASRWDDLVEFEFVPVVSSTEPAALVDELRTRSSP